MTINKLNYEVYAIDYLDGNLSEDLQAEMEQFLLFNPEVAQEIAMFDSMVFVPDESVKYVGKQDLKKPMKFAILNYMNWIVPVCMSLTFMVVYPYFQGGKGTNNSPQREIESVEPTEPAIRKEKEKQTVEYIVSPNEVQQEKTVVASANIAANSAVKHLTDKGKNVLAATAKKEGILAFAENAFSENENSEEEKSTVDFGRNHMSFFASRKDIENCTALAAYPNVLPGFEDLSLDNITKTFGQSPTEKLPYFTISIAPYSIGYDMAKTMNIADGLLVKDLPINENSYIEIGTPIQHSIAVQYHISDFVAFETGYSLTKRNINYYSGVNEETVNTTIKYISNTIPVTALFALPFVKGADKLKLKTGLAANWMGRRAYKNDNTGGAYEEAKGKAAIVPTENIKLVSADNTLKLSPSVQLGFEYEKNINNNGTITFALTYDRQMSSSNTIRMWDYNLNTDNRVGVAEAFDMRFETVSASVKYTLPQKWYVTEKKRP